MTIIYVVEGQTGEYSDNRNWPVRAFISEKRAKDFVIKLSDEYRKMRIKYGGGDYWYHYWDSEKDPNPLDPDMLVDYVGVEYSYYSVELDEYE